MMNSNPKFDLHPDAESLNAFVEHALPERERGELVAHLAECGRCREVVYLAQETAGEMHLEPELVLAVAAASPRAATGSLKKREPWFRGWRLAWVPAGVLAVTVTAAVVVHERRVEIAAKQAKAAREAAARSVEMASTPRAPSMGNQAEPAPASPALSEPKKLTSQAPNLAPPVAVPPPVSQANATVSVSSYETAPMPMVADARSAVVDAADADKSESAPAAKRQEQEHAAGAYKARGLSAEKRPDTKTMAGVDAVDGNGAVGGVAAAPMTQFQVSPAKSSRARAGGLEKHGGILAIYKGKKVALPSGLTAASTAVTAGETVAVDGAGGVFLSEDVGSHWVSVAKQWTGRAVEVRLQTAVGTEGGTATSHAVFEIVNDQGQMWTSTDGRIWKAK